MSDVTRILSELKNGNRDSSKELLPLVYDELRRLASHHLAQERQGQTFQATALVHEAYLRLVDAKNPPQWDNCGHFFAAAAKAMRRLLIDSARSKLTLKRGGNLERVDIDSVDPSYTPLVCDDLLGLDVALKKLKESHPRKADLVELRFFAGLTMPQAAQSLGISLSAAEKDWSYARSWLRVEMSDQKPTTG